MSATSARSAAALTPTQGEQLAALLSAQLASRRMQLASRQGQQSFVEHAVAERQQDGLEVLMRDGAREVDAALSARDRLEIVSLGAALHRIDSGTYGICVDCAAPIGYQRLLAQPDALRCAACEAVHEERSDGEPGS